MLIGNESVNCRLKTDFFPRSLFPAFPCLSKDHGGFACRLETSTSPGVVIPEGLWAWYFGGAQSNRRVYGLNKTLCSVESIPSGRHTLVLEVEPDQVARGIAVRFCSVKDSHLRMKTDGMRWCRRSTI